MEFELPLTEKRVKPHQVTALHLFVALVLIITASVVMVSYYAVSHLPVDKALKYRNVLYYGQAFGIALFAVSLALILIVTLRNKWLVGNMVNNILLRMLELIIMLGLTVFALINNYGTPAIIFGLLAVTIIFAIYWERMNNIPLVIHVDKTGIKPPVTSRRRFLDWKEVAHVVFRFGTLTVNCYDNRMYQWTVGNVNFEKELFDVYCIRQIDLAKDKRDKSDW